MAGLGDLLGGLMPSGGGGGSAADYQRLAQMFQQLGSQGGSPVVNPWVQGLTGFASGLGGSWAGGKADEMGAQSAASEKAKIAELLTGSGIDPKIASELGVDDAIAIYKATKDGSASFGGAKQVYNPDSGMTEWFAPGTELHGKTVGASNYGRLGKGGGGSGGGGGAKASSGDGWQPGGPANPAEEIAAALTGAPAAVPRPGKPNLPAAAGVTNPAAEGATAAPQVAQPGPGSMPRRETDRPIEADQVAQPDGGPGRFSGQPSPVVPPVVPPAVGPAPAMDRQGAYPGPQAAAPANPGQNAIAKFFTGDDGGIAAAPPTVPTDGDQMPDTAAIQAADPGTAFTVRIPGAGMVEMEVVVENGVKKLKKKAQ